MPRTLLLVFALLPACGPAPAPPAAASSDSGDADPTTPQLPTTTAAPPDTTGPDTTSTTHAHDFFSHFDLPPEACDPIAQDCADGWACFAIDDAFLCTPDPNAHADINDPCAFANDCVGGLACLPPATTSATCITDAPGCCTPFCQLPDAPCPNPDQQCLPWYDPMRPIPPDHEKLGFCGVPP